MEIIWSDEGKKSCQPSNVNVFQFAILKKKSLIGSFEVVSEKKESALLNILI